MNTNDFEIVVGTYENLLLGYKIIKNVKQDLTLESSFTDDSHRGALRCLAVSPNGILASSSTDDSVRLHSLRKRKDIGGLFEHRGTVNCIQFFPGGHMFSASEDGTICMWKCKNWEVMKTLKGHKAHVNSVAIHPSGKLALSTGQDKSFLTWDLVTGKLAFQRKLQEAAQHVLITASGDHYALVYNRKIEVCALADTEIVTELPFDWRINAVCLLQDNILAVGGDSREVLVIDLLTGKTLHTLDAGSSENSEFNSRVRALCKADCGDDTLLLVGAANGNVKGFKMNLSQKEKKADTFLLYETKVRMTCLAIFNSAADVNAKEYSEDIAATQTQKNGNKRKRKTESESDQVDVAEDSAQDSDQSEETNESSKRKKSEAPKTSSSAKLTKKQKRKDAFQKAKKLSKKKVKNKNK